MKPQTIYLLISFLFKVDWCSFPSISVLCPPSTLSIYIIPKIYISFKPHPESIKFQKPKGIVHIFSSFIPSKLKHSEFYYSFQPQQFS